MDNTVVSVVIPTYNRGAMVGEAIDTVLTQNYRQMELIVVDDGSTDHTSQVLKTYQSAIRVLRQHNRGVSAARNRGIAAARGGLIAFLDSDDLWLPGKLAQQVAFFETNPAATICQTQELWMRNGIRINPKRRHRKPSGMIFEPSLALCLVSPSAVMLRRGLLEQTGGFDENLPACEDYDLWLRISWRHPVYLLDQPLVVKRGGHPDQLSRSPCLDRFRIQSLVKLLEGKFLSAGQRMAAHRTLSAKCTIFAAGCRKRGRLSEAHYYENLPLQLAP